MRFKQFTSIMIIMGAVAFSSCSTTRSVPANDKLYTGASVSIETPAEVSTRQRKTLRSDLEGLTRPRPNSKFLGIPFKLGFYNLFANAKPNSFFGKLRNKIGEPPVLLSQFDLEHNQKVLQSYLENKGFFHAKVSGDTTIKRKKASASFKAVTGAQYHIASVNFPDDSSELARSIQQVVPNTLLQVGKPFDLDVIKGERIRLDAGLKERGYYFFSPEYLLVQTDSTIGGNKVNLFVRVKPETPQSARLAHRINNVFIYSNYSLNSARLDTSMANAEVYKGYTIVDRRKRYKPMLLEENMQFHAGEVYNRVDHNQTLSRLINLNLFKFVKNRFEVAPTAPSDSPRLDAFYYLTPLPSKTLRGEVTAISRSNNLNGSQLSVSWLNRNLFRNGTQLSFTAYVGSDIQFSGALRGYNTYRTGAEITFAIPRIVLPFIDLRRKGPFAPRTTIQAGYDILNRKGLYTLNSYRFQYGYVSKKNLQVQHELYPVSITYVQPLNVTPAYDSLKNAIIGLDNAIQKQFILGGNYQYTFNGLATGQQTLNAFYFNGVFDVSGNIAGLLTGANVKKGDTARIANTPFSQYVKMEADGRYYRRIGLRSTWANRINFGVGIPYGNSVQVPYVKQFFVGGNNSLRGFRSRSVGPGVYLPTNSDIIPDQTGDIKLELNTEFRPHISGPLYGAFFLEAGNIWLFNDSTYTRKPGAKFTSRFLSQLAVDAGVGIRLDINIFVIRLDLGFPLRKPWESTPWVIDQVNFGNRQWRRENIVYNLAIGYPF